MPFEVGDLVSFPNKTGKYIGKVLDCSGERVLLEVQAVLKHPLQGDLHSPKQVNVSFFHERKALAFGEKLRLLHGLIRKFEGDVPDYKSSLDNAVASYRQELIEKDDEWSRLSLHCLDEISKDYKKY